jgi:hypothetical protein
VGLRCVARHKYIHELGRGRENPLLLSFDLDAVYDIKRNRRRGDGGLVGHTIVDMHRGTYVGPLQPSRCVPFCAEYDDSAYSLWASLSTDLGAVKDLAVKIRALICNHERLVFSHDPGLSPMVIPLLHAFPGKVVAFSEAEGCYSPFEPDEQVLPWAYEEEKWGWE